MEEVMNTLGVELWATESILPTPVPDIPALRKQAGCAGVDRQSQGAVGVQLTHEEVKRLSDKEVEKYFKKYNLFWLKDN